MSHNYIHEVAELNLTLDHLVESSKSEILLARQHGMSPAIKEGRLYGFMLAAMRFSLLDHQLKWEASNGEMLIHFMRLQKRVDIILADLSRWASEPYTNQLAFDFWQYSSPEFNVGCAQANHEVYKIGVEWLKNQSAQSHLPIKVKPDPEVAQQYMTRGAVFIIEENDYESAIADFTIAIKYNPKLAAAYNNRALAQNEKKNYEKAILDANQALYLDPRYNAAYFHRAVAQIGLGNMANAVADCTTALDIDPTYSAAYAVRGKAKIIIGDLNSGIKDCTIGIDQMRKTDFSIEAHLRIKLALGDALIYRGLAHNKLGDFLQCRKDFIEGLQFDPAHSSRAKVETYLSKTIST